jgi:hypothetical protein
MTTMPMFAHASNHQLVIQANNIPKVCILTGTMMSGLISPGAGDAPEAGGVVRDPSCASVQRPAATHERDRWTGRPTAHETAGLLTECYPSQSGRNWFGANAFVGLMRVHGVQCGARHAEAFVVGKAVLDSGSDYSVN